MSCNVRRAPIALIILGWLFLAGPVKAQVKDDAGFFSAAAVSQADQAIRQIKQGWNKDVKIETVKGVPADKLEKFKALEKAERSKFYADWARARAEALSVKGIYVLIVKQQGHLEIDVDDTTTKKGFPQGERAKLRDLLLENFKKKDFDAGLTGALALVRARLEKNLGPPSPPPAIVDDAPFFTPAARARALTDIQDIKKRFQNNVVVETFKTPPPDIQKQLEGQDAEGKSKVLAEWLRQRSAARGGEGLFVLICKDPPHIRIGAGDATFKKAFLPKDRDELGKLLLAGFKDKQYDQALAAAVVFVYDTMDRNTSASLPSPAPGSIQDLARFFSDEAKGKAAERLGNLKDKQGFDLSIETFPGIYPGGVKRFSVTPADKRGEFFRAWARERAQQAGAKGVWVLICKEPPHIQVSLGAAAAKAGKFNAADRDGLSRYLEAGFKAKQFDRVLLGAPVFVSETMRALPVKDEAGYFDAKAVADANQKIKALRRKFKRDVLVETIVLPADKKEAFEKLEDAKAKDQFFADLLQERAKAAGAGGVQVLISKDPKRIQVGVAKDTIEKFPVAERDLLRDLLVARFKEDKADKGLLDAVAYIYDTLPAVPIKDDGAFFSAAAVDKANAAIRDIRRRFARDVLIETFNEVPPDKAKGVNLEDAAARRKFFAAWAEERQKSAGLDAISLLVCKSPMSLQVAVGEKTKAKVSKADRDKLVAILIGKFKAKDFDAGLAEGLALIATALQNTQFLDHKGEETGHTGGGQDFGTGKGLVAFGEINGKDKDKNKNKKENVVVAQGKDVPGEKPKPSPVKDFMNREVGGFKMEWLIWGILILLALWIFIGVLRALFARRPAYYPPGQQQQGYGAARPPVAGQQPGYGGHPPMGAPGPYYGGAPAGGGGGGGGGFFSGLLGGMFGAAAGSWLYSRFAGNPGSTTVVHSGSQPPPQVTHSPGTQTGGTGYSSSGGDFGEESEKKPGYSSSGGDFGEASEGQHGDSSSGGDFGQQEESGGSSSGGDFGAPEETTSSSGGDFGAEQSEPADTGGGGDFGGSVDTGGGDAGGGGDFGGSVDTGGGGDFGGGGGGGDSGGGGGGDFGGGGGDAG